MSDPSPSTGDPETTASLPSPATNSSSTGNLIEIPPFPVRKDTRSDSEEESEEDDEEEEEEEMEPNCSFFSEASPFGLNYVWTRSIPSPLRFSSSADASSANHDDIDDSNIRVKIDQTTPLLSSTEQGEKFQWNHSKSVKNQSPRNSGLEGNYSAYAKEIQSPRFQAILRVTSRPKKRTPDIKSFSHELNSTGVRPFPLWKPRALGHVEEIIVAIRAKFDRLKEEVDYDLITFAGDLVGIIQTPGVAQEMKEGIEDLLVIARRCAKMEADEFWVKCEGIVQELDDKRQELQTGIIKQAHTRILFILSRCTRLVQFQKESRFEENRILGLHQLSDIGVYPELLLEALQQDIAGPLSEKQMKKLQAKGRAVGGYGKTKEGGSPLGSYRMSSWKKLPSPAAKNRNGTFSTDAVSEVVSEDLAHVREEMKAGSDYNAGSPDPSWCHPDHTLEPGGQQKVSWGLWGDQHHHQHNVADENLMICRICEVEIPTAHAEEHSRICTIADRCDLKGLTVNERLERVAETLDKMVESFLPKGTPKRTDAPAESSDAARVSTLSANTEAELSPRRNSLSCKFSNDMLDCIHDTSSGESLTPQSPLLTPRTSHVEVLVNGRNTVTELENHEQIVKLMEVARSVANANTTDYSTLQYMVERLEYLKYLIQDRKVDALVIETFGRCIEKLIQEKYVHLSSQIEDEKVDTSNCMVDEETAVEEDTVQSLRTSPINACPKDRTRIEDFEIIKPISRGAFGRVFLAKKRSTGDLFAIKVLKKADMIRKNAVESILAERNILISLRNSFVVRFFYSFTCRENLYLVMEYLNGGDLYSLLRNLGCLDEAMARIYIAQVILALEYLHSLNVVHRDLKPDNLLISQDGHIKLTDFGLSKVGLINSTDDLSTPSVSGSGFLGDNGAKTPRSSKREARQKQSVVGTPDYLAPEILLGISHGVTADWWSVGIILFELLVGIPPFNADHPQKIFDNIINRDIPWPRTPDEMSYEAYDLIDKLLTENPVQRLGATGAGEVKKHPFFKNINWDTLARQKAMFIPSIDEAHDTSYFMSRYVWNLEDDHVHGGSDFDDMTETCSSGSCSYSNVQSEDGDECGSLAEFTAPALAVQYSFSNFSFKNLSQLASINYDLVVKRLMESSGDSKPPVP